MKKILLLSLLLSGCTIYSEKQSEAVSQSVYATKDSIDNARIDLAQQYINETTRIIVPPKKKIQIKPLYSSDNNAKKVAGNDTNRQKFVTLPETFKNDKVVFVNTDEYKKLLEDKKVAEQLKWDYYYLDQQKKSTDEQLVKNKDINNKMVNDLNRLQKQVYQMRYSGLIKDIIIILLLLGYGLIVYLKLTKPIPFL